MSLPSLLNSSIAFDGTSFVQVAEVLGSLRISRILPGCNVTGENVAIAPTSGLPINGTDITVGPNGFAIVWLECANQGCNAIADARLYFRLLTKNLCRQRSAKATNR